MEQAAAATNGQITLLGALNCSSCRIARIATAGAAGSIVLAVTDQFRKVENKKVPAIQRTSNSASEFRRWRNSTKAAAKMPTAMVAKMPPSIHIGGLAASR